MPSIPILTPDESAAWDARAAEQGLALATLMETAGRAVAQVVAARYPERLRTGVLVAAGTGHNGGDGWVVARALHRLDVPVWVAPLGGTVAPLTAEVAKLARAAGVREIAVDGPWPQVGLVIDAILGTGARGAPRADAQALLDRLHDLEVPVVAVDGPTGVDLLNGVVHGAARAELTITFGGLRRGHLLARDEMGAVVVADIGHPTAEPSLPRLVTDALAAEWLPRLGAREHKGDRGRIVLVGGAPGMNGAIRIAGRSAFAAGAGLVHAVAPAETVAALMTAEPDVQTLAHPLEGAPSDELRTLIERADAVIVGPGLGRGPGRREFVLAVLGAARAAVVDADALFALQGHVPALAALGATRPIVLTPHPGEFRTLFPELAGDAAMDPWTAAHRAAAASGVTVLLKGVPSVVATAEGAAWTIAAGNPGLATGGSGDLLSGLVGAALARAIEPPVAAALGAQVLGRAADIAARRVTARGMRPMDVVAALPDLWREWDAIRLIRPAPRPPVLFELERPRTV